VYVFYLSIRTTENYEFDKIRTAGVTGNATIFQTSQGDNPICSTRDEISQPSRPISPRAASGRDRNLRDLAQISRRDRDFVISAETETWKFETETETRDLTFL